MINCAPMYHKLSVLLRAGVPILQSLRNAAKTSKGKIRRALSVVADSVSRGDSLVEAMSRHPKIFMPLDVILVEAGAESGNLTDVLEFLSRWYNFRNRLRRTIVSGMVFPIFLIHFAAVIGPAPAFILKQYGTTQYYMQAAVILGLLYVPTIIILSILHLTPKTGPARLMLDAFSLRIPLLGRAIKNLALSRFCRAFTMLYKAGIPIIECVEVAAGVTGNAVITRMVKGGADSGRAGNLISAGFSRKLSPDLLTIWQVGEETGKLDEAIEPIGDEFAEVAELLFNELATWMPRLVYFGICIVMAFQIIKSWRALYGLGVYQ